MSVEFSMVDGVMTAYISGEIDHHSAKYIREAIDSAVEEYIPEMLLLDFSKVTFMDSSGIGLVMGRYKLMQKTDGVLRVMNASERIRKIMKLAGLSKLSVISD